jgi:hypothetical protein
MEYSCTVGTGRSMNVRHAEIRTPYGQPPPEESTVLRNTGMTAAVAAVTIDDGPSPIVKISPSN